ncbi:MAG: pyridoxal phosphate-dependent aminotransferase [Patescibacteria group bacterium]
MRNSIANPNVHFMKYQIREVVDVMQKLKEINPTMNFVGENIGDPIAKGWNAPPFLKQAIIEEVNKPGDKVFGYSHSRGLPELRQWVVEHVKKLSPASTLNYEDVLFTSGLGAAISVLYQMMPEGARVIQPTPAYPAHTSMEAFSSQSDSIFYQLDPKKEWQPDLADLESQIQARPEVAAVLIINPNNPTGAVYQKDTLEAIVRLAEKYQLMIISDEVYFRMVYNGCEHVQIIGLAQDRVPLVVLRGLSKDLPWPGGRSGWIEFHNTDLNADYQAYADGVKQRILMEVCSTSLPQFIMPKVYDNPEYKTWLANNNKELETNGNYIAEILNHTKGLSANRTNGAFYMLPLFAEGVLNNRQTLPIGHAETRAFIERAVGKLGMPLDQRFTYYLLAATGICVVPASGFYSPYPGFRLTTLDRDEARRKDTYARLSRAVEEYLASA